MAIAHPSLEGLDYVPLYCEENVWRLLSQPRFRDLATWAVLVFGQGPFVEVRRQRLGTGPLDLVRWDYHALALAALGDTMMAWDFDSREDLPCPALGWARASFGEGLQAPGAPGAALFRVLPGEDYQRRLASDRSHMRRPDGTWLAPPPPWPAPRASREDLAWTLQDLLSPEPGGPGRLMDLSQFRAFCAQSPHPASEVVP